MFTCLTRKTTPCAVQSQLGPLPRNFQSLPWTSKTRLQWWAAQLEISATKGFCCGLCPVQVTFRTQCPRSQGPMTARKTEMTITQKILHSTGATRLRSQGKGKQRDKTQYLVRNIYSRSADIEKLAVCTTPFHQIRQKVSCEENHQADLISSPVGPQGHSVESNCCAIRRRNYLVAPGGEWELGPDDPPGEPVISTVERLVERWGLKPFRKCNVSAVSFFR